MDQSHTSKNATCSVAEAPREERNDGLLGDSGELSANQSAADGSCSLSGGGGNRGTFDCAETECTKQHGVWCRLKAFSLTRSAGLERGIELEDQDEKDGAGVSRLSRLKRLRKGQVRQDRSAFHFIKAEREFRRKTSHLELQIDRLNAVDEQLLADARIQEANIGELQRKLRIAERRLVSSQRQTAKLNWILELAKLQGNAQQQVLDVKQDDVIKMAVKQAELYDQIRKLKLTIETLRNKLEKYETERSSSEYQPHDEGAEHPSNMPLSTSVTQTMNQMQAAVDARRLVGRHENNSEEMPEEVLDHPGSNVRDSMEETRQSPRMTYKLLFAKRTIAQANRRVKHQRAIIAALRANVKNKGKRIQDLIHEKDRIHQVLERVRQLAKIKIEVIYKNLLSLPDDLAMATSPLNVRETIRTYLKEVDSSASVEEVERIVSRLKEFGRFLGSDDSFEEFMKNRKTQHSESLTPTLETAKHTTQNQGAHLNNVPRRRVLRRQKVNKAFLETRPRAARSMSSRTDPGRKDCMNLGRGGKHCRSCCYDAKMQKLASLQVEHRVEKKVSLVSAENDGSKSTQELETNQVNEKEMIDGACQVLPDDINSKAEVDGIVEPGMRQHPELSEGRSQKEYSKGKEQTPSDRVKNLNVQDELLKEISPAEGNIRPRQSEPLIQDNSSALTANGVNMTQDLCPEDNLEKQKDLIKRVSDLLVDKWCLEGQVKALEDNERELTEAKSEISLQLDAAHRQLSRSCSDTGRLHPSHNGLALEDKLGSLQRQLKEMEDRRDDDEAVKSQLQSELDDWKTKVVDLEAVKKRLEGEVEGWMETVMEVRRGRITLLNHMDNITNKLHRNRNSFKGNEGDSSKLTLSLQDRHGHHSSAEQTCGCRNHDLIRVNELQADIETLSEQRKIQDAQIEQLSDLLQKANDQKQQLMNHLTEVQQERRNLQVDFDSVLACD